MSPTTIKVDSTLRDQLMEVARAEGKTAGSLIESLLQEHLEREILAEAKRRIQQANPEDIAEYLSEFEEMDASLNDGLDEYAGEYDQIWAEILKKDPDQAPYYRAPIKS